MPCHFLESLQRAARLGQLAKIPLVDAVSHRFEAMTSGRKGFWDVVHRPYIESELSGNEVRVIVARGLAATHGSYKRLLPVFGMSSGDYGRFMGFLRHHRLKPSRQVRGSDAISASKPSARPPSRGQRSRDPRGRA